MPAATAHAAIRHDAPGLRTARAHVARLFLRSGGSHGTCFVLFVCEGNDTDCYLGSAFGAPLLIRSALSARWMPAAAAHGTIRHDASGLRTARAHVAHLFARSGGSCRTCFVLFVCEGNDTDCYLGSAFGAPLLIRSALSALDASCGCAWHDQA